jgi:hypothetical protein
VVLSGVASNCSVQGPDSVRVTVTLDDVASATFEIECRAVNGVIYVDALISGRDFDPDGFTVHMDDSLRGRVGAGWAGLIDGVSPGSHVVTLGDFSPNCSLTGPSTRTAEVNAGGLTRDTVTLVFEGTCEATTGDVLLITTTEGADRDPNGYTLTVDGELLVEPCGWYDYDCEPGAPHRFPPSGYEFFYQVPPGDHTYRLGNIAANCEVLDGESRVVSVTVGDTATVRFPLTCNPV